MNHLLIIYAFLLPVSKYAGSFVFFLLLVLFIVRRDYRTYLAPAVSNPVVQAFILFFLIHLAWLAGTDNFHQAKQAINLVKYALFPILFFSFIDKRFSHYIIGGFIAGILFSELVSYAIQFNILPWTLTLFSIPIFEAYAINDPSPFLHHSHYATSIAFVAVVLIYKLIKMNLTLSEKAISIFFIVSISINLTLVGGRIGYLLYVFLILFLTLYTYKTKAFKPLLIILLGIGTFFLLAYTFSPIFSKKIDQSKQTLKGFTNGKMDFTSSFGARIGFNYYAAKIIADNPLFGVGTGDYMDVVQKSIPESQNNHYIKNIYVHPHNIYIMLLLQFGVFGLIFFFYILYQIFRQKNDDDYLNFIKYAIMMAFAIALMTETFWARYYLPLFVLIISVSLSQYTLPAAFIFKPNKKQYVVYFFIIILAAVNAKIHFIIAALK